MQYCHLCVFRMPHDWPKNCISYIKTVSAISDCFPNCFTHYLGKKKMETDRQNTTSGWGACPKMNLGRTDILTPSHGGGPSLLIRSFHKYFLSSRHCSKSLGYLLSGNHILLRGDRWQPNTFGIIRHTQRFSFRSAYFPRTLHTSVP